MLTSGRDQLPASPLSYPELPQEHENIRGPRASTKEDTSHDPTNADPLETPETDWHGGCRNKQLEQASTRRAAFIERLSLLVEHEQLSREQRKQARLVKQARLKPRPRCKRWTTSLHATWSGHRWQTWPKESGWPGPEPAHYRPLWLRKTYLACALATKPVSRGTALVTTGCRVCYSEPAKVDGSYARLLGQLARIELLILDDWGLEAVNAEQRNALLEIMDDRYGKY